MKKTIKKIQLSSKSEIMESGAQRLSLAGVRVNNHGSQCHAAEAETVATLKVLHTGKDTNCGSWIYILCFNPRGDLWAEFGPRDQCRSCARPKSGPIWYDVVVQFSFPSLVTDPGKKGIIRKLIHSSSCANFIQ